MKLPRLFGGLRARHTELDEELASHLRMAIRDRIERGEDPCAAELAARREFGSLALIEDTTRDHWRYFSLERLFRELRHALRGMRRDPGFTAAAVCILGVGMAAATIMFSLVDTVLLRPLPFPGAGRILTVGEIIPFFGTKPQVVTLGEYRLWRESGALEHTTALESTNFTLLGAGPAERIEGVEVTADFFRLFGIRPQFGRDFQPGDDKPGAPQIAILSHQLWSRKFHSDPAIVGQSIHLGDSLRTVVGVMPPGFDFPRRADISGFMNWAPEQTEAWVPFQFTEELVRQGNFNYLVLGRLPSGVPLARAQARLQAITYRIYEAQANQPSDFSELVRQNLPGIVVKPQSLQATMTGGIRSALWMLLGAVILLLVLIYANVANLFLTRSASRLREQNIRQALGASRWHLFEERFVESAAIGILAAALCLFLSFWGLQTIKTFGANRLPRLYELTLNPRAILVLTALGIAAAILFGAVPGWIRSRPSLATPTRTTGGSRAETRLRSWLVTAEIALSLVLLVAGALLLISFRHVLHSDPGFDTHNLLTAGLALPWNKYPDSPRQYRQFERLLDAVRHQPGVEAASMASAVPLTGEADIHTLRPGATSQPSAPAFHAEYRMADPDYLRTMDIPLIRGRWFRDADPVSAAVVSQRLADRLFPGQNPLGLQFRDGDNHPMTVVGVVGEVRNGSLEIQPTLQYYRSGPSQVYGSASFLIRTRTAPENVIAEIRRAVHDVDPDQPLAHVRTMQEILNGSTLPRRFETWLLTCFAAIALFLSVLGVFGVLSLSVARRSREFGIRIALGASRTGLIRLVMSEAARLVAAGVIVGLALTLLSRPFLKGLLFGVTAGDPGVYAGTIAVLATAGLFACWIPARKAAYGDPARVLREE